MDINGIDVLPLIEARPVIWDRTLMLNQRRAKAHVAWNEIGQQVYDDYLLLTPEQQELKIRYLMKKWGNLRDNWLKRHTKEKKTAKRYIHANKLDFLCRNSNYPQARLSDDENNEEREDIEDSEHSEHSQSTISTMVVPVTPASVTLSKSQPQIIQKQEAVFRKQEHPSENAPLKNVFVAKPPKLPLAESRHISFIRGLLPLLETFNEDETFDFQTGVLNTIRGIRMQRRQQNNISNPQISNEQINGQQIASQPIIINGHWAVQ